MYTFIVNLADLTQKQALKDPQIARSFNLKKCIKTMQGHYKSVKDVQQLLRPGLQYWEKICPGSHSWTQHHLYLQGLWT